jgi:DNA-binding NtrC family response regulator
MVAFNGPRTPGAADAAAGDADDEPEVRSVRPGTIAPRSRARLRLLASQSAPLHIHGPSGAGKEAVAREVHELSQFAAGPFVAMSCANVPTDLAEAELCGVEKGSHSTASERRTGLFETAAHGTLFLDEIGEASPALQAKLLRFVQEMSFMRLGGRVPLPLEARIITATHKDLRAEVRAGRFRADLYHRLCVLICRVDGLRERLAELDDAARSILASLPKDVGPKTITPDSLALLRRYRWPGNFRELRNVLLRTAVVTEGAELTAADLLAFGDFDPEAWVDETRTDEVAHGAAGDRTEAGENELQRAYPGAVADPVAWHNATGVERVAALAVAKAVHVAVGNKSAAAKALGISRQRLDRSLLAAGVLAWRNRRDGRRRQ